MRTELTPLVVFEETLRICKTRYRDPAIACLLERAERAMQHHASRQVLRACLQAVRVVGEIEERNRVLALIGQ